MCSSRRRNGWRFSQEPWPATAPPVPTSFLCLQHSGKNYLDFAAIWASAVFLSTLHPVLTHGFVNYMPNVHTKHCCATQLFPASPARRIRHQAEVSAGHTLLSLCTKSYSCLGQFVTQYSGPLDGRAEEGTALEFSSHSGLFFLSQHIFNFKQKLPVPALKNGRKQ